MRFALVFATLLRASTLTLIVVSGTSGQDGNPIPDEELSKFLGPVSPDQFEWRVLNSVDFDVYYGKANPPLSGSVGFYLGFHPQEPKPGQTTSRSRLGRFPVKWSRRIDADGSIEQDAVIRMDSVGLKAHVWASAPTESQLDNLLSLVGQLPLFASGAIPDRFKETHDELVEEQRISRFIWIGWSALVIAGAALVDYFVRRRQVSAASRLLSFAGVIAFAIAATFGGVAYSTNFVIHWFKVSEVFLLLVLAGAVGATASLLGAGFFLVRLFRARNSQRKLAAR